MIRITITLYRIL